VGAHRLHVILVALKFILRLIAQPAQSIDLCHGVYKCRPENAILAQTRDFIRERGAPEERTFPKAASSLIGADW
jgi:hypothetical protein